MTITETISTIHLAVWLLAGWALCVIFWRSYRVDAFRQRLFNLRDELFHFAAEGWIAFDEPAYFHLRGMINSLIRFSHKITFTRFVLTFLGRKYRQKPIERREPTKYTKWRVAVDRVEAPKVQTYLVNLHERVMWELATHIVTGNPIPFAVVGIIVGAYGFARGFGNACRSFLRRLVPLEDQIYQEDAALEEAVANGFIPAQYRGWWNQRGGLSLN